VGGRRVGRVIRGRRKGMGLSSFREVLKIYYVEYLYEGNFGQGRRHGYGKIRYDNGDFY
jgi:hypothetical protein